MRFWAGRFCFDLGITLKRVEVIPDDEDDIAETARRMSERYDLVITSGGIGPTHDDITYASLARAFSLPLVEHRDAFERMKRLSKPHPRQADFDWETPSPALEAKRHMVILPHDAARPADEQAFFVRDDLWVPIAVVNGNVHVLPGVPRLFEHLLDGLRPRLEPRLGGDGGGGVEMGSGGDGGRTEQRGGSGGISRVLISTPLPESAVAPYLTELAKRVGDRGVKVGSYPRWGKSRNTVTLVGRDARLVESLVPEVEKAVDGRRVVVEGEDDSDGSDQDT